MTDDDGLSEVVVVNHMHSANANGRLDNDGVWTDALFANLLSALPQAILLVSDSHGVEYVNQAFCDLHRLSASRDSLIGKSAGEVIALIRSQLANADADITRFAGTYARYQTVRGLEIQLSDGRTISADWLPVALPGRTAARIWVANDITERKKYEAYSAQRENDARMMLEGPPLIVVLTEGRDQMTISANRRLTETLGYTVDDYRDAEAWWPLAYPDPEYRKEVSAEWDRRIAQAIRDQGSIEPLETRVTCADGSVKNIEWGFVAIGSRNVTYGMDRTEFRRAENERKRLLEANLQLEKSRSLDRMAGAIAHHFNNQLHAVMMSLQIAADEVPRKSDVAHLLQTAQRAAESAAGVSNKLLTYLGMAHPTLKPVDLRRICAHAVSELQSVAPGGVTIRLECDSDVPIVRGKEGLLDQAVKALVTNAWESTNAPVHEIRVVLDTVSGDSIRNLKLMPITFSAHSDSYVRVSVIDHGGGINGSDLDSVFEPFFTSKFVGRGLGLPIVLGIARTHDGAVQVETVRGKGTTFRLLVPVPA